MRRLLTAGVVMLGLLSLGGAQAQQIPPASSGVAAPGVHLDLTVEQTKLIVETLGAIGCQNVQQLIVCQAAAELRNTIRDQVKGQVK